jgi:hypothetical protein
MPSVPDAALRITIWLALLLYVVALTFARSGKPSRGLWTAGCLLYLLHVIAAFHFVHHWSHADAMEHTERVGGFGEGIFVNHLFTLLWTADVISWWLWPHWHEQRPRWIDVALHGFMLFVIFNAAVVFVDGPMRWVGVGLLGWLTTCWFVQRRKRRVNSDRQL